jgi:type VI secretion system protein ImpL
MLSFLRSRAFIVLLGFVLFALFVWYAGPLFSFADYAPLQQGIARVVVIGAAIAAWIGWALLTRLRAARAGDRLMGAVVRQSAQEAPSAQTLQLRERFEESVATLRQKRRGGHVLYDLPWYVIVGAPGSGKTTALLNSGLHFPLEGRSGKGALRGVGGTRNCDWWFTDEAVFLDTAGRFTTQDSDPDADSAGWAEFLSLLRKYRQRRPLNGVILAISAHDLLVQGRAGREEHVDAARRRLAELNEKLGLQLPVYVLVTKCDLIAGFTEYFNDLTQDGRAQIWGVTFPVEQTRASEAAQALPGELDALVRRLNERLFGRVEDERDVGRRSRAFGFPQQVAALVEPLTHVVTDVFASSRFDRALLLRGVYFTSGTQEGTPIDRLLGALGRQFAVAPDAVSAGARGKAYFIERLLTQVLIPESGLAGVNRRLEIRKAAFQLGAYAALAAVALLGVVLMSMSYVRGRSYIDEMTTSVEGLREAPAVSASSPRSGIVRRLDALARVVAVAEDPYVPWYARWVLYQGRAIGEAARDAYFREINGVLVPRIGARLEQLIASSSDTEDLYEYLKGYLMLGERNVARADRDPLAYLPWDDEGAGDALTTHLLRLLEQRDRLRPVTLDEVVVRRAQSTIRNASIPQLVYRNVVRAYEGDARALQLDVEAGVGAVQVLRFRSGRPLSDPVPALYTKEVFGEVSTPGALADVIGKYTTELWVWGDAGAPDTSADAVRTAVLDIYERDYIERWDAVLDDVEVVSMPNMTALKEGLAVLAAPSSPLRGLLVVVDTQTHLVEPPDPAAEPGVIEGAIKRIPIPGLSRAESVPPGTRVTDHFAPIHQALSGAQGAAPIDAALGALGQIRDTLATTGDAVGEKPAAPETQATTRALARSLENTATLLPPAISEMSRQVARTAVSVVSRGASTTFERQYRERVLRECVELIRGRYPFVPASPNDVPLADFAQVFGYGGVFDRFFTEELQKYADTTRSPWTWRANSPVTSSEMLRQFEAADRIRRAFFRPGSRETELQFRVQPTDTTSQRFVLELDGQRFEYLHFLRDPELATWPGPRPGMALATFDDGSGPGVRIPGQPFDGPWAWFRLVDAGTLRPEGTGNVEYVLTLAAGPHVATVRIEALNVRNPFGSRDDLPRFSCGP